MYLAKINYKKENVVQVLSSIIKDVIDENTVIVCIGTDRAIGDALGPLVGTMLKNSDFKYPCLLYTSKRNEKRCRVIPTSFSWLK